MKALIFLRIIISFFLITFMGCSKDLDNSDSFLIDYGTMQAKVSGLTTIPNNMVIDFEPRPIRIIDNSIWMTGEIKGVYTAQLSFTIPSTIDEPGVYSENIGGSIMEGWTCSPNYVNGQTCWYEYLHNFHSIHNEVTLTITQLNEERLVGNYTVVGGGLYNQVNIDGYFDILRE